jgi:hypothetical protein
MMTLFDGATRASLLGRQPAWQQQLELRECQRCLLGTLELL